MAYLELKDSDYTQLRKDLLKEKGSPLQRELLEATKDGSDFVSWIEKKVDVEDQAKDQPFDSLADRLTEAEYKDLPQSEEKKLFDKWASLTPAQASQETFWGYVTLEHIRRGVIRASYLAANRGNLSSGLGRIEKALADGPDKAIDAIVHTILRHLSGLPEKRGSKSVFVNCPFARAWWRGYVAKEVCNTTGADFDKVAKTLRVSQDYWEMLIVLIVSRNSVLGDTNVRTALIWALSELVENKNQKRLFIGKALRNISRQIGIRAAWQELGMFSIDDLKQIIEQQFLVQH